MQFLLLLELTGARPKELAAALVVDFDGHTLRRGAHELARAAQRLVDRMDIVRDGVI